MGADFLIEAEALKASLREHLIVDARKPETYLRGHIPGAINLSTYECFVRSTRPADLAEFRAQMAAVYGAIGTSHQRSLVVYEDDTGMRAARELWILEYLGHPNVRMLHGGLMAWTAARGKLDTDVPVPVPAVFEPVVRADIVIAADDLFSKALQGSVIALDVRNASEFTGQDNTACCARRGHIPRAVWIEWTELLDARSGKFKPPSEIRRLLALRGVDPAATLAPYCHRGARSANTYYALRYAGIVSVCNFIGSFHEWSARAEFPIET